MNSEKHRRLFPPSFDLEIYKNNSSDLQHFKNDDLYFHYLTHGCAEGRLAGSIKGRHDLASFIRGAGFLSTLEIGPFDCPVLIGENVKYFDVLSKEELIERAKKIGRTQNLHNIPFIDFISSDASLDSVKEKFDLILSCHAIEHQLDFIQHMNDVSKNLKQNGYYVIICPDKRYCFDHFIPETTIAEIIFRHFNPSKNHSIKSVIEHRALTCHNDAARHWAGDHGEYPHDVQRVKNAIEEYRHFSNIGQYIDVHAFQFTPHSFHDNMRLLFEMSFTDLIVEEIYPTLKNNLEFFVVLQKTSHFQKTQI